MLNPRERAARARNRISHVVFVAVVCLVVFPVAALAADATIGLYTDSNGNSCSFNGNSGGPVNAYVIVKPGNTGIRGARFSAPIPSCFNATYISDQTPDFVVSIGSSPDDITVAWANCEEAPVYALQITYLHNGGTTPCCEFPIQADPFVGSIEAYGCDFTNVPITTIVSRFNADESCACGTIPPVPDVPPPVSPSNPTPYHGAELVSVNPRLMWFNAYPTDLPLACDVYFGTDADPPLFFADLQATGGYTTFMPGQQTTDTVYFWRIVVRNAELEEATGPVWSFTTAPNSPPTVRILSPLNGAADVSVTPTLSWHAVDAENQPMTYDVYLGPEPSPPLVASNLTVKSYAPPPLAYLTRYLWRVVARDAQGSESSSGPLLFTTKAVNEPPAMPSGPNPTDRAIEVPLLNTSLSWHGSDPEGQPLNYDVYFGTYQAPTAATIGLYSDAAGSSCSFNGSAPGLVTAYLVIKPGTAGVRSVSFAAPIPSCFDATFVSEVLPPGAAWSGTSQTGMSITPDFGAGGCILTPSVALTITYLANGSTTPCCEFPIVADPRDGLLRASDCNSNPTPISPVVSRFNADESCPCEGSNMPPLVASNRAATHYATGPLALGTKYQWRIVARDTGGLTTSSRLWTFTSRQNQPPVLPSNPSPADFAQNQPTNKTLSWECSDPEGHAMSYDVHFGPGWDPPKVASNITSKSYDPGALQLNQWYYWRIVARDALGAERSSSQWSFRTTVGSVPPATPSNPSPPNGAVNQYVAMILTWSATDPDNDALSFDVYFGTQNPPPLASAQIAAKAYDAGTLDRTTTYWWKVVARDAHGVETPGPLWSFTTTSSTSSPPFPASNPVPPNGGMANNRPRLSWQGGDPDGDVVQYHVFMLIWDTFPELLGTTTNTFFQVEWDLQTGWTYPWYVVAHDGQWSTQGPLWTFLVSGGAVPVAFQAFEAEQNGVAVEVRWQLSSDEAIESYVLYRDDSRSGETVAIARGELNGASGTYLDQFVEAGRTYQYELVIRTTGGDEFRSAIATVSVEPLALALHQNVPNPFNPQTVIRYDLPAATHVRLSVFGASGRRIRGLVNEDQSAGSHEAIWTGRDDMGNPVASGVYFYVLDVGKTRLTKKLVLLK